MFVITIVILLILILTIMIIIIIIIIILNNSACMPRCTSVGFPAGRVDLSGSSHTSTFGNDASAALGFCTHRTTISCINLPLISMVFQAVLLPSFVQACVGKNNKLEKLVACQASGGFSSAYRFLKSQYVSKVAWAGQRKWEQETAKWHAFLQLCFELEFPARSGAPGICSLFWVVLGVQA